MLGKIINYLSILSIINFAQLYAMNKEENEKKENKNIRRQAPQTTKKSSANKLKETEEKVEETYIAYLTKNSFVTGTTVALVWLGERWSVDVATGIIENTVKSSNFLLDWTVSSAIRGKSIQEALPIAQERGKLIGIGVAGMVAPLVWDYGGASLRSCHKIARYTFEDNFPTDQKPTKRDYFRAGLGTTFFGAICYTIYKSFSH